MAGFGYQILGFGSGSAEKKIDGVDYLVLAGGGSGGASGYESGASGGLGGGGGAGGFIASYGVPQRSTTTITAPLSITVGSGGTGGLTPAPGPYNPSGNPSTFSTITAAGGGAGGSWAWIQ